MSLIIKGLDMPKKGERYNIILLDDGSVTTFKLDNKRVYESFKNNPLEKYEAIQIERPHGMTLLMCARCWLIKTMTADLLNKQNG